LEVVPVEIDAAGLRAAAAAAHVPEATFLEASWHALLARLTGAGELLIASWSDGRAQPDLEGAVGPYSQPLPVRSRYEPATTFAEVLDQVTRGRAEALRWQDFATSDDAAALVDAAGFLHIDISETIAVAALRPSPGSPLVLSTRRRGEQMTVELWHDAGAYSAQDAADLALRFKTLLADATREIAQPISLMTIVEAEERAALIEAGAGPAPEPAAPTPVHRLFERQARLTPDAPAVADATSEYTYGELNAAANRLGNLIRELGADRPVGICMERSCALLEAVLAILKAGSAYVPLNYEHPPARIAHQLSETGARILVTEEHLLDRIPSFEGEIVCIEDARIASYPAGDFDADPAELAYVMYTSGSTGLPKGVAVTHENLSNYATHIAARFATAGRWGVVTAISTDLGNTSIFPALISGGCVQLISPQAGMDATAAAEELGDRSLAVLKITPSHLGGLLPEAVLPEEWLVLGGEALSWDLVAQVRSLEPALKIVNHYGPTETTVGCCAYDVGEPRSDCATVPIGSPLAGARAYVLDTALEPLPAGVPGELCIAGLGVARGYIGAGDGDSPFVSDPFSQQGRMYRTGDRARRLRDGTIEFLGRLDDQVKIRGFRIELGEVEAALRRHPGVRQAAVVAQEDFLTAYITTSAPITAQELRSFLVDALPDYMIPASFVTLEALPFTPSGKVDRRGLRALEKPTEMNYLAPRTPLEQKLADIWGQLLGRDRVGIDDDFFALGGHSLLAARVVARVRSDLAVELPLASVFTHPTIASLTEEVVRMMGDTDETETARLLTELEGLSDEEAARLLSEDQ
jgi:amino acid adenylation domain-containing protein